MRVKTCDLQRRATIEHAAPALPRCRLSLALQQATPRRGLVVGAAPSAYAQLTTVRAHRCALWTVCLRCGPILTAATAIAIHRPLFSASLRGVVR
jgi:hypothetical protein